MQKIVFIYGPSCAGKTVVAKEILKQKNFFHVHYDLIKWFISDYQRDNKKHRAFVSEIMLNLIERSLKQGFSILVEGLCLELFEEVRQKYKAKVRIIPINVTASKKVLEERFLIRLEGCKNSGFNISNISNTSLDVFWELYEKLNKQLEDGFRIDTSDISIEETKEQAMNLLK